MDRDQLYMGCIADDFTGAGDAASFLWKSGLRTVYVNGDALDGYRPEPGTEAVVIALKSRSIPAAEAVRQSVTCGRWLLEQGAQHLYFKYCSTFGSTDEGNIGPVTDALMELCGAPYTVLCPALPVNGRTVREGVLYVNGVPLADSPMRFHPLNPMRRSRIAELMTPQSAFPCYELDRALLYGPADALQERLSAWQARSARFTLVPEHQTDQDGQRIAAVFGGLPLLTGGSGLLEPLGRLRTGDRPRPPSRPAAEKDRRGRLLLAGSCSQATLRQIARYQQAGGASCKLEPGELTAGNGRLQALKELLRRAEGDLLIYSSDTADKVAANQQAGAALVSGLLERAMGELAVCAVEEGFHRLVVAGGETSGSVTRALGYGVFHILGELAPGVPEMVPAADGRLRLALKSGNFGGDDFLLTALNDDKEV